MALHFFMIAGLLFMEHAHAENVSTLDDSQYVAPSFRAALGKAPGMRVQLLSQDRKHKVYAVIFSRGDEVMSGLNEFAEKYHVRSAHFTAIGGWDKATLGWFSIPKNRYKKILINGQVEVASMIGDISLLDKMPIVHTHVIVSFEDGSTKAGHLLEAYVSPTLEVMVSVEQNTMYRRLNNETGLSVIDPELAGKENK